MKLMERLQTLIKPGTALVLYAQKKIEEHVEEKYGGATTEIPPDPEIKDDSAIVQGYFDGSKIKIQEALEGGRCK
jgi:hypothetical protein